MPKKSLGAGTAPACRARRSSDCRRRARARPPPSAGRARRGCRPPRSRDDACRRTGSSPGTRRSASPRPAAPAARSWCCRHRRKRRVTPCSGSACGALDLGAQRAAVFGRSPRQDRERRARRGSGVRAWRHAVSARDEHGDDRLLAPGLVGGAAHGAPHRFRTSSMSLRRTPRDAVDGADRRIDHQVLELLARSVGRGDADGDEVGIAGDLVFLVEHDIDRDMAGKGQLAAVADAHRLVVADQPAVLVDAAERHLVDDLGGARRQPQHVAVAHLRHLGDAGRRHQRALRHQMRRLAMHRNADLRPRPFIHLAQLVAARMAGDMHQRIAVLDDLDALVDQPVLDLEDRLLVAGNGARGKDHRVAGRQRQSSSSRRAPAWRVRRAPRPGCRCT